MRDVNFLTSFRQPLGGGSVGTQTARGPEGHTTARAPSTLWPQNVASGHLNPVKHKAGTLSSHACGAPKLGTAAGQQDKPPCCLLLLTLQLQIVVIIENSYKALFQALIKALNIY